MTELKAEPHAPSARFGVGYVAPLFEIEPARRRFAVAGVDTTPEKVRQIGLKSRTSGTGGPSQERLARPMASTWSSSVVASVQR